MTLDISHALTIPGWMSESELLWLASQAHEIEPGGIIVEVGTYLGRSARAISDNVRHYCGNFTMVYCVDPYAPFDDPIIKVTQDEANELYCFAIRNVLVDPDLWNEEYIVSPDLGSTRFIRKPSVEAALRFCDRTADMVFLDGDHTYPSVMADIGAWLPKIRPGGILCGHDYTTYESVRRAVDDSFRPSMIKRPAGSIWAVTIPENPIP